MSAFAGIADSLLRRALGWQARRSCPRRTVQVRLRALATPHGRLATRLRDFATKCHEQFWLRHQAPPRNRLEPES